MEFIKKLVVIFCVLSAVGCANGLNKVQEREYSVFEIEGALVEEKNPSTGAVLGLLPGGGSFYAREPGFGVVNLLLWPLSILWDPISGYDGAKAINYDLTKYQLKRKKKQELAALSEKLEYGEIDSEGYTREKWKIIHKYNYD